MPSYLQIYNIDYRKLLYGPNLCGYSIIEVEGHRDALRPTITVYLDTHYLCNSFFRHHNML